jgi:hypothetical protein
MSVRQAVTPKKITINDLRFGDTDARSEILNRDRTKKEFFIDSFYVPEKLKIKEFKDGEKYFISGQKGTGKTALLRYINEGLDAEDTLTSFVVFKEQVTERDKQEMFAKNVALYDTPQHAERELLNVWRCFLHREIVRLLDEDPSFYDVASARKYIQLVKEVHGQAGKGLFNAILSGLKSGKIRLDVPNLGGAEVVAEFGERRGKKVMPTTEFVRLLDDELGKIKFKPRKKLYVFVDEINLAFSSTEQHARDTILIRDLIVAVGKSNEVFIENDQPIIILAAVRSEIITAVDTAGAEIGKWLKDFGHELNWYVERDIDKHPIVGLVEAKLKTNMARLDPETAKGKLWTRFFAKQLYKSESRRFVVRNTWGRPRDIVNLLSNAAEQSPRKEQFDTEALQNSFAKFSKACWEERAQELNVFYSDAEVVAIRKVLQGFKREFSLAELGDAMRQRSGNDATTTRLRAENAAQTLMNTMYLVGIVGQKKERRSKKIYWKHTGQPGFNSNYVASIHQALWAELHLTSAA